MNITDNCEFVLIQGKNKGNKCSKKCKKGEKLCNVHFKNTNIEKYKKPHNEIEIVKKIKKENEFNTILKLKKELESEKQKSNELQLKIYELENKVKNLESSLNCSKKIHLNDDNEEEIICEGRCFKDNENEISIKVNNKDAILIKTVYVNDELKNIVNSNDYVKSCISNDKKDKNSFSYIITKPISQSDCIKMGIGFESVLKDIILKKNTNLKNIKPQNKKGNRERDHLFKNDILKTIYYAELKCNLNLDTEKYKSTNQKCLEILDELKLEYPEYKIKMYLVGVRYYCKEIIPKSILNKYNIKDNILGINEYLKILNTNIVFTEYLYKEFVNYVCGKMFKI
jgi:hypothetical protein